MMRTGMAVRHKSRPDWGVGELVAIEPDSCTVRFLTGPKTFDRDRAALALEITDEALPPTPRRTSKAKAAATKCKACGKMLRTAVLRNGDNWKACPSCTAAHGSEHILGKYPNEFVPAGEPLHNQEARPSHSHCIACRAKEKPSNPGRLCSSFD